MTKHLRFENAGLGIALAADYFDFNGTRIWVDFMSMCEGRGKLRTWYITANHYEKGKTTGTRVEITKRNCFRYEAADEALAALLAYLSGATNPKLAA